MYYTKNVQAKIVVSKKNTIVSVYHSY